MYLKNYILFPVFVNVQASRASSRDRIARSFRLVCCIFALIQAFLYSAAKLQ